MLGALPPADPPLPQPVVNRLTGLETGAGSKLLGCQQILLYAHSGTFSDPATRLYPLDQMRFVAPDEYKPLSRALRSESVRRAQCSVSANPRSSLSQSHFLQMCRGSAE